MNPTAKRRAWLAPAPPHVAVELASGRVTVAELSPSGGGVVSAYASESLPADAIVPALVGVNIAKTDVVADALRRALDRAGLRSARRAALVVPDSVARVSLLPFEQLPAKAADLDQLVRWQLKKAMPFPVEDARLSYFPAHTSDGTTTLVAVAARRDVLAQYEQVTAAVGMHAGIVDLASFNVMNLVISAGEAVGDWLLVCVAEDAATLAILRGPDLMFYRHRAAVEEEPLSALVHQVAMYHEDRLGGAQFARVRLCGAALAGHGAHFDRLRMDISEGLGVAADAVDVRRAAGLRDRITASADVLDALAAPVGVLLRERKAA